MKKATKSIEKTVLSQLIAIARGLKTRNKNFNKDVHNFLEKFINNFNDVDKLNKNTTPLALLLDGLRKTDVKLISKWFELVTNAKVSTNSMGHYTLKFDEKNKERTLILTGGYNFKDEGLIRWYHADAVLGTEEKKEPAESYKDMKTAIKNLSSTLEKSIKTCKTQADIDLLMNEIKKFITIE